MTPRPKPVPNMAKVHIDAEMPDHQLKQFLQMIREWEWARDDVEVTIAVQAPEMTVNQVSALIDEIDPPLPMRVKIDKPS